MKFLDLKVDAATGRRLGPGFGALNKTRTHRCCIRTCRRRSGFTISTKPTTLPRIARTTRTHYQNSHQKLFRCIGVAPPGGESRMSITPGEWGGNMDAPEASVGHMLYLPVNVAGASFVHGRWARRARRWRSRRHRHQFCPRSLAGGSDQRPGDQMAAFENATSLMTVGAYRPLDDA